MNNLKSLIDSAIESYKEDDLVTEYNYVQEKRMLNLKVDTVEDVYSVVINIPESYPKGSIFIMNIF